VVKFFRRIRQKLVAENKFSRYLIYAIGEIILVVIGILIALQVNNWKPALGGQAERLVASAARDRVGGRQLPLRAGGRGRLPRHGAG
jgi:hypothetical protein